MAIFCAYPPPLSLLFASMVSLFCGIGLRAMVRPKLWGYIPTLHHTQRVGMTGPGRCRGVSALQRGDPIMLERSRPLNKTGQGHTVFDLLSMPSCSWRRPVMPAWTPGGTVVQ